MFEIEEIENIFKNNANPPRAEKMAAYMRNKFDFYGIPAGKRSELTKPFLKEAKKEGAINWQLLTDLFSHNDREINYLGLDLLKTQSKLLSLSDFERLVGLASLRPWWDTIDNIDTIIGSLGLTNKDFEKKITTLARSENFWLRRIAIGHQRKYKEKTNTDLLAKIIKINLSVTCKDKDEEFFIAKAIGWALREYSKTNPDWVRNFLTVENNRLPRLSTREASKYL